MTGSNLPRCQSPRCRHASGSIADESPQCAPFGQEIDDGELPHGFASRDRADGPCSGVVVVRMERLALTGRGRDRSRRFPTSSREETRSTRMSRLQLGKRDGIGESGSALRDRRAPTAQSAERRAPTPISLARDRRTWHTDTNATRVRRQLRDTALRYADIHLSRNCRSSFSPALSIMGPRAAAKRAPKLRAATRPHRERPGTSAEVSGT